MIPPYQTLIQRITTEWSAVCRVADRAKQNYLQAESHKTDQELYLEAISLNLHGFYSGLEHIFEWIARQIDGVVPSGYAWHQELLTQMTLQIPGIRPAVIQKETQVVLQEYLGFRHVVRNVYSWDLQPDKIAKLIHLLPSTLELLEQDLTRFRRFLTSASRADE